MLIGLLLVLVISGAAAYEAPRFLLSSADKPVKSDAIILFLGGVFAEREKEAFRLLHQGYARYLIIPAFHRVIAREPIPQPDTNSHTNSGVLKMIPPFYERTHVEELYAKKIMDSLGLKSAIMVSSPYHMRRIRLIASRTFGEQSRSFSYVPTPFEYDPSSVWDMGRGKWMFVINEYIKICWFHLYSLFIS